MHAAYTHFFPQETITKGIDTSVELSELCIAYTLLSAFTNRLDKVALFRRNPCRFQAGQRELGLVLGRRMARPTGCQGRHAQTSSPG
jgi:hypothetical protein